MFLKMISITDSDLIYDSELSLNEHIANTNLNSFYSIGFINMSMCDLNMFYLPRARTNSLMNSYLSISDV